MNHCLAVFAFVVSVSAFARTDYPSVVSITSKEFWTKAQPLKIKSVNRVDFLAENLEFKVGKSHSNLNLQFDELYLKVAEDNWQLARVKRFDTLHMQIHVVTEDHSRLIKLNLQSFEKSLYLSAPTTRFFFLNYKNDWVEARIFDNRKMPELKISYKDIRSHATHIERILIDKNSLGTRFLFPWTIDFQTPRFPIKKKKIIKKPWSENCTICFAVMSKDTVNEATSCAHIFHRTCLNQALSYKMECPNCRQPQDSPFVQ